LKTVPIIHASVWGSTPNNTQQLNQKQREGFEKTLRESLYQAKRDLEQATDKARDIAIQKLVALKGADELATQIIGLNNKLTAMTESLEQLGFEVRDKDLALAYRAPDEVREAYEKLISELTSDARSKVEELSEAIQASWAISTLPEAKKLIESFA
jgi:uncharacterized membrane protein